MATSLGFDAAQSTLVIETRAKGMLAKLAHDLSIKATALTATASLDEGRLSLELLVAVSGLRVDGVRKGNVLDKSVLSRSDRSDIEKKIRGEVLRAEQVVVKVSCDAPSALLEPGKHELSALVTVELGRARAEVQTRASVDATDARVTAKGRATVTLPGLGIAPIKGPLGAFRVDDDVVIVYELAFTR